MPVLADESVFSPADALRIMQTGAADLVNIKLMKCGGITNALRVAAAAEVYGVECMIGCMLEAKISVNAAVELACAKKIITKIDLDGPVLCSEDHILGGAVFNEKNITVSDAPGMGIQGFVPGQGVLSRLKQEQTASRNTRGAVSFCESVFCIRTVKKLVSVYVEMKNKKSGQNL